MSASAASPSPAPERAGYHHGALREALLAAAEAVLAERGLEGFSLREVARRSGVSPAAPAHHFGDAQGLLNAVAAQAFEALREALEAGNARGGTDPPARLREQGLAYVDYALAHPARFNLMFRCAGRPDAALQHSGQAAYGVLEEGIRRLYGLAPGTALAPAQQQALMALWSVVHGFAHLLLSGQLDAGGGPAGRAGLRQGLLAPLLEQQLRGLVGQIGGG